MTAEVRADIYTRITSEIAAAIAAGAGDWHMPWHHGSSSIARPANVTSGKPYRGVNTLVLWIAAQARGYVSGTWGTYRQWQELGAQVRKGERSTAIILWKRIGSAENDQDVEDGDNRPRFVGRGYSVFNRCQVDGYEPPTVDALPETERIPRAEAFFAALCIPTTLNADAAYYRIDLDRIFMPSFGSFKDSIAFIGTFAHEAAHTTGAKHRLDRDLTSRFSHQARAIEELVAELTAGYILADLGLAHHPRPDHAAYIASWLKALNDDPRAIFTAASKAQQAADWMHAQQPPPPSAPP